MASFNWLHLTDLHWGMKGQTHLWPNLREVFFEDLELLHDKCGPWNVVLFSGDFVQKGSTDEFDGLTENVLDPLWDTLKRIGSQPVLLGVPGNHDLTRPVNKTAAVRMLVSEHAFKEVEGEFWDNPDSEYRVVVEDSFKHYMRWWRGVSYRHSVTKGNFGILPGDFAATVQTEEGLRIGILGLNTAFLQLTGGDFQGKLTWDLRQAHAACGGDEVRWYKEHDACILMTHHGPEWLRDDAREEVYAEINPAGRFAVHLFGHMHKNTVRTTSIDGSEFRRFWQGSSLFGMEFFGESNDLERRHGYSAGMLSFGVGSGLIRHWPRRAVKGVGGWRFVPDHESCELYDDDGTLPEPIRYDLEQLEDAPKDDGSSLVSDDASGQLQRFPRPPVAYYVHPYPLQKNFTGRTHERELLTSWLNGDDNPLLTLSAIGGMGKSALAWVWLVRDIVSDASDSSKAFGLSGAFWWSFYEREASFENFLSEALRYVSSGALKGRQLRSLSTAEKVKTLINLLRDKRYLLVLDGFERELRAYASTSAAYLSDEDVSNLSDDHRACIDQNAGDFLTRLTSIRKASKVLVTTRLLPRELDKELEGSRIEVLEGMQEDDVVLFFKKNKVAATRAEILESTEMYGFHALAVRLLVGVILNDKSDPGDIRVAARHPILPELRGKEKHHILEVAYDSLDERTRLLLSQIAAFRTPMTYKMVCIFDTANERSSFDEDLDELIDRGLLFFDRTHRTFDLHPVVRQYSYDRLLNKQEVALKVRGYFEAAPLPGDDDVQSFDDLSQVVELFHHTVCSGYHDIAYRLYNDRLERWVRHFGADLRSIELLNALCDNEQKWPMLESPRDRSGALAALAESYAKSGQPREAIRLYKIKKSVDTTRTDASEVAKSFCEMAFQEILIGDLKAARGTLDEALRLGERSGKKSAMGLALFGYHCVLTGELKSADERLSAALELFSKAGDELGKIRVLTAQAQCAQMKTDIRESINLLRIAQQIANRVGQEEAIIVTSYKLGLALSIRLAGRHERKEFLRNSQKLLDDALTRCHRTNLVSVEADILRSQAIWQFENGQLDLASELANDAMFIADRCEYDLVKCDIHLVQGKLALKNEELTGAIEHAVAAKDIASRGGNPHCYKYGMNEAAQIIAEVAAREATATKTKARKASKEKRERDGRTRKRDGSRRRRR